MPRYTVMHIINQTHTSSIIDIVINSGFIVDVNMACFDKVSSSNINIISHWMTLAYYF